MGGFFGLSTGKPYRYTHNIAIGNTQGLVRYRDNSLIVSSVLWHESDSVLRPVSYQKPRQDGLGSAWMGLSVAFEETPEGQIKIPTEMILWADGQTKTTKGLFLLDDKARQDVWGDWQERMANAPRPSGEGSGSFDYDHDEWKEDMPGWQKKSAGSFDLGLDGKDLWLVNCRFTDHAKDMIAKREKRSTSGAFDFTPKTGRYQRLYNVAITNIPATYNQPLLTTSVPMAPMEDQPQRLSMIQVPAQYEEIAQRAALAAIEAAEKLANTPPPAELPPSERPEPVPPPAPVEPALMGAIPHAKYPLDDSDAWDASAAEAALRKWASSDGSGDWDKVSRAQYAKGFGYVHDKGEAQSDYVLPHHTVKDGDLVTVWGGVKAAGNALAGSRGGVKIPEADIDAVKKHLAEHYHEFGKRAPWEPEEKTSATATAATTSQGTSMYGHMEHTSLMRHAIGHCADGMMMSGHLARMAKEPEEKADHLGNVKHLAGHMGELVKHAMKAHMSEMPGDEFDSDSLSLLGEHADAFKAGAKFAGPRAVVSLDQIMASLDVKSAAEIVPALSEIKERATNATKIAKDNGNNNSAACAAKIAELQKTLDPNGCAYMSPVTAQEALGLNPATGKADDARRKPWTMLQLTSFETRAKGREQLSVHAGVSIVPSPTENPAPKQGAVDPTVSLGSTSALDLERLQEMNPDASLETLKNIAAASARGEHGPASVKAVPKV